MNKEVLAQGAGMRKANISTRFMTVMFLAFASLVMVTDASATSGIMVNAIGKSVKVTACTSCHTSANGTKTNLYPGYRAAWLLDKANLTRFRNAVNGCAIGKEIDPAKATYLCETLTTLKTGTVGLSTSGAAKSDVYKVDCPTGTSYLGVAVRDKPGVLAPKVSITALKTASVTSAEVKDGDGIFSPWTKRIGGAGIYMVTVTKAASTTKGIESYGALISCRNSAGVKLTPKSVTQTSNN